MKTDSKNPSNPMVLDSVCLEGERKQYKRGPVALFSFIGLKGTRTSLSGDFGRGQGEGRGVRDKSS